MMTQWVINQCFSFFCGSCFCFLGKVSAICINLKAFVHTEGGCGVMDRVILGQGNNRLIWQTNKGRHSERHDNNSMSCVTFGMLCASCCTFWHSVVYNLCHVDMLSSLHCSTLSWALTFSIFFPPLLTLQMETLDKLVYIFYIYKHKMFHYYCILKGTVCSI